MEEMRTTLITKLNHQINLCQELLRLCYEQRNTVKKRDLAGFQAVTEELTSRYQDFHNLYLELGHIPMKSEETKDAAGKMLEEDDPNKSWQVLNDLMRQLRMENQANMLLINNSLQVMRQITKLFQPDNSFTYENKGNIKKDVLTTNTLNKTV